MVRQLPDKLQLEEFYQWLDQGKGDKEGSSLGQRAKVTVNGILNSADDRFDKKIVDDISSKVSGKETKTLFMVFGLVHKLRILGGIHKSDVIGLSNWWVPLMSNLLPDKGLAIQSSLFRIGLFAMHASTVE